MYRRTTEYKQINRFLSLFSILQHSQGSTILSSDDNTYLIRNINLSNSHNSQQQKQHELNDIIMTLSTHQSFNCKNILPLINFDIVFNKNKTQSQIRAIYSHGRKALVNEILQRKGEGERFDQDALWSLIYSLASPLAYLEQKNIIYGVLDAGRVFLDNDVIAIMDPSSTGIDPYEIVPNRLYSPQLLQPDPDYDTLNMFKSDVFVMGLLLLQCSLLKLQLYDYTQSSLSNLLSELQSHYSQSYYSLISSLLNFNSHQRPSFDEILIHVNEIFQIATNDLGVFESAVNDEEDQVNEICWMETDGEGENVDILETEYIRVDQQQNASNSADVVDKSEMRFYHHSNHSQFSSSPINQSSEQSQNSSLFIQDSMVKSLQKTKRVNKPKQIKEKLIKNDYQSFSTIGRDQTMCRDFSHSVINKNQIHRRAKTDYDPNLQTKPLHKKGDTFNQIKLKQSKQNQSYNHNFTSGIQYSPLNKENLFTKPEIMNMIKNDMKKIQDKKKKFLNVNFSYVPENQEKQPRQIVKNSESHQKVSQSQNQTKSFHQISLNSNRK